MSRWRSLVCIDGAIRKPRVPLKRSNVATKGCVSTVVNRDTASLNGLYVKEACSCKTHQLAHMSPCFHSKVQIVHSDKCLSLPTMIDLGSVGTKAPSTGTQQRTSYYQHWWGTHISCLHTEKNQSPLHWYPENSDYNNTTLTFHGPKGKILSGLNNIHITVWRHHNWMFYQ